MAAPSCADDTSVVYVYFRTRGDDAARARALLDAHLAGIAGRFAIRASGGIKTDARADGEVTWLEIYQPVPGAVLDDLKAMVESAAHDSGLLSLATSGRHFEVFRLFAAHG